MVVVKNLCDGWHWDLIDAFAFMEKDFAFDKCYMVDKARVTDIRTGRRFKVGIVINEDNHPMGSGSFADDRVRR